MLEEKGLDVAPRRGPGAAPPALGADGRSPRLRQRPGRGRGRAARAGRAAGRGARPARDRGPARRRAPTAACSTPSAAATAETGRLPRDLGTLARRRARGRRPDGARPAARPRRRRTCSPRASPSSTGSTRRAGEEAELAEDARPPGRGARRRWPTSRRRARRWAATPSPSGSAQALRALERARERAHLAGAEADNPVIDEARGRRRRGRSRPRGRPEALAAVDAAAEAFDFEPDRLEKAEERLFALRAAARKLGVAVDDLPAARVAHRRAPAGRSRTARSALTAARAGRRRGRSAPGPRRRRAPLRRAAARPATAWRAAVEAELAPLKLDKARFRVAVEPLPDDRAGPCGRRPGGVRDRHQSRRAVRRPGRDRLRRRAGPLRAGAEGRAGRRAAARSR